MGTELTERTESRKVLSRTAWGIALVLVGALAFRAWNISTWSMWEDEQGSMALSQHPFTGFAGYFPNYFVLQNLITRIAGPSVGAARVLPAALGLLSIALTYFCFRRFVSPRAALWAALFLALNIGHLFWSQSIRYYTLALVFQLLAMYWFLDGFEHNRVTSLLLSLGAFILALLTHFSALLLAPVLIGYLLLMMLTREREAGYTPRNYIWYLSALAVILILFAWRIVSLRNMIGGWEISSARDPVHVGTTVVAYFGVPVLVMGLLAPWLTRTLSRRVRLFLLTASFIPVLELLVISWMNIVNVTWYYAFISLIGFTLLAGAVLEDLRQCGRPRLAAALGGTSVAYYLLFLGAYHLMWHGDRPRWQEAAEFLNNTTDIRPGMAAPPDIHASVPGVVEFYLGDPSHPEGHRLVSAVSPHPEAPTNPRGCWYIVEAKLISPEYESWFAAHCVLRARFESLTGPIDRSVLVYEFAPIPKAVGHSQ